MTRGEIDFQLALDSLLNRSSDPLTYWRDLGQSYLAWISELLNVEVDESAAKKIWFKWSQSGHSQCEYRDWETDRKSVV